MVCERGPKAFVEGTTQLFSEGLSTQHLFQSASAHISERIAVLSTLRCALATFLAQVSSYQSLYVPSLLENDPCSSFNSLLTFIRYSVLFIPILEWKPFFSHVNECYAQNVLENLLFFTRIKKWRFINIILFINEEELGVSFISVWTMVGSSKKECILLFSITWIVSVKFVTWRQITDWFLFVAVMKYYWMMVFWLLLFCLLSIGKQMSCGLMLLY